MTMLPWKLSPMQAHHKAQAFSIPADWWMDERTKAIHIHNGLGGTITDWVFADAVAAPWQCGQVIIRQGWIYTFRPILRRHQ